MSTQVDLVDRISAKMLRNVRQTKQVFIWMSVLLPVLLPPSGQKSHNAALTIKFMMVILAFIDRHKYVT